MYNLNYRFSNHQKNKIIEHDCAKSNGMKKNCPVFKMVLPAFQRELYDTAAWNTRRVNSDPFLNCVIHLLDCPKETIFQYFALLADSIVPQHSELRTVRRANQ